MKQIKKFASLLCVLLSLAFMTHAQNPTLTSCMDAVVTCYGSDTGKVVAGVKRIGDPIGNAPFSVNWPAAASTSPLPMSMNNWKVKNLGQIFGTAIDNSGNVFFAATSMYSQAFSQAYVLARPSASVSAYSPVTLTNRGGYHPSGGPAGIYKADAANLTNISTLVTSSATPSINTFGVGYAHLKDAGFGIGNIASYNGFIYATLLDDGKIYQIDAVTGIIIDDFDPFNPDVPDVQIAPYGERLFAVAINEEYNGLIRVYYSRLNSLFQSDIYSVQINATTGSFLDATNNLEINVRPNTYQNGTYISDIAFSSKGEMLIAEKGGAHQADVMQFFGGHNAWSVPLVLKTANASYHNSAGGVDFASVMDSTKTVCDSLIWMQVNCFGLGGCQYYGIQSASNNRSIPNGQSTAYMVDLDPNASSKGGFGDIEFYDECCPNKPTDICSEISVSGQIDSNCCLELGVRNDFHDQYFTGLLIESHGTTIAGVTGGPSWGTINYQSSTSVLFEGSNGQFIPDSSFFLANFCFAGNTSGAITVKWIGNAPQYDTVCTDTIEVLCAPPIDTNCASAKPFLTCDNGVMNLNFSIRNHSNFIARGVTIFPQTAGVNDPRIFVPIADVLPGDTSTIYQVPISIDDTTSVACFHFSICDINADPLITSIPPNNCCIDSIDYCAQVPSCEPCDAVEIFAPQQDGNDCCFNLTLTNNYLNDDIACLRFKGQKGAQFALFSGWNVQAPVSSNEITVCAPGGKVGQGTFTDFAEFCLTGTSVSPHLVVVEFLNAKGEVLCIKDLDFPDCDLVQPTCANIVNDSLYCDGSKMYYTFDVQNNSPFDICQFDIRTSDSTVKTTPSFFQPKPCIRQGAIEGPFTITIDTARADLDFLCLYLTGHNAAYNPDSNISATQCCTDSMGVICLPFIPCDSISNCCDVNNFVIPTGLTPNGDGFNDEYKILNTNACDKVKITVFNRWGNVVFVNADFKNDWQGTNKNGDKLAQGTYYVLIETPNGNKKGIYLDLRY